MPKISPVVNTNDKNGLDMYSQLFAEYFCCICYLTIFIVNNFEITYIKTLFDAFKQNCAIECISQFMFLDFVNIETVPLFTKLIKIGDECIMDWNHFFRFIIFSAFSPCAAYFYFLMVSFTDIKTDITFPDVLVVLALLNKGLKIDEQEKIKKIFKDSDMNGDGHLSLNQFYNFVENSQNYWETIFKFKTNVVNAFFPHGSHINILERKLNIEDIKDYQTHNGKFPKPKCGASVKMCLFGVPNPYEYDYESTTGTLSLDSLVTIQIKTYKPFYEPAKKKETFQIKHLSQFTKYKVVHVIDKYYIKLRDKSPEKMKSIKERRKNTISSSSNNLLEVAVTSSRKPSILRSATLRNRRNTLDYNISGSNPHNLIASCTMKRKSVPGLVVTPCVAPQPVGTLFETPIALHLGSSSVMVGESVTEVPE